MLALRQTARSTRRSYHVGSLFALAHHLHQNAALGKLAGHFDRLGNARACAFLQHDAVNHHIDEMLDLLVQNNGLSAELRHFPIDANAGEALLLQVLEELGEFPFSTGNNRRHDKGTLAFAQSQHVVGNLVGSLRLDLTTALRAMRSTHACEKKAQVIVDFRNSTNRRSGVFARGFLIDGNRWGKAVDGVEVGLAHLTQKLARIAGKTLHIATLTFCINGVEGQGAFTRTGEPRNNDKLVARDLHIDVFEIMLACTLDDD